MALKYTLGYLQYIKEAEEAEKSSPLLGYKADQIITRIEELMEVLPDKVRFGIPSDNLGRSITYRDANGVIQKIKDILHYYDSKNEPVRFYCWSVSYTGSWEASQSLKEKVQIACGFGEEVNEEDENINLKKLIEYFSANETDSDNLQSISIAIDSPSVRKAKAEAGPRIVEKTPEKEEPIQKPTDSEI